MAPSTMSDNHQYPGIDLALRHVPTRGDYSIGAHPNSDSGSSLLLQVREVAMMNLMDRLTDKPNWHEKVFDDEIVSKWRQEAMTQPEDGLYPGSEPAERTRIISQKAFNNCVAELRDKAKFFKMSGLIYTLDSETTRNSSVIIKTDALVKPDLHQRLKDSFDKLLEDQASNPDWHPWTSDMVQDIVHPSMYPFVHNRSHFIHQEVVGVNDAIDKWSGKGEVPIQNLGESARSSYFVVPPDYWSEKYQWLPSTLAFQEDGTVRFTSYINNLHPKRYPGIYKTIEKLIDTCIPAWDHALSGSGSFSRFDLPPEYQEDTDEGDIWEPYNAEVLAEFELEGDLEPDEEEIEEYIQEKYYDTIDEADEETVAQWREDSIPHFKWKKIRDPILPEPVDFQSPLYECGTSLRDKFKSTGLQVYVKMASVELTPEKPDFPAGGWHIEGQMNEQIVATALYYVDSKNVTSSRLSFRMQTDSAQNDLQERIGQDMYDYYEALFGFEQGGQRLQHYGSVETKQGRLLAFPNTFQHQVSSFSLKDRTKPGHRRFIALWLVNPDLRVISTANVPPQQFDWWFEAVAGATADATASSEGHGVKGEMPPEVMQLVLDKRAAGSAGLSSEVLSGLTEGSTNRLLPEIMAMVHQEGALGGLMTAEEADKHRIELMKERSRFHVKSETQWGSYSFCEH